MTEHENAIIRAAMLVAQSDWLEEADRATNFAQSAVAKVIAEAFANEAAKYKTVTPLSRVTDEMGWSDSVGPEVVDVERREAPGVHSAG